MKKILTHLSKTSQPHFKKLGILILLTSCLYGGSLNAQRNHQRDHGQPQVNRQSTTRQQTNRPQVNQTPNRTTVQNRYPNNNNNRFTPNRNNPTVNRPTTGWTGRNNSNYNNDRYRGSSSYRGGPRYSPSNPSWRYSNFPRRNTVINIVPRSYRVINYGGFGYRYYNGTFYRPYNTGYMVVAPPIGIFIDLLPLGSRRIYVHNYPYYYYNGTYYDYYDHNYRVVSPPVGAVVESIPDGYQTITIDGETYYEVDGAQYKPVVQDNGEIWYEVIKAN